MFRFDVELFRRINAAAGQGGWLDALGWFAAKPLVWVMIAVVVGVGLWEFWSRTRHLLGWRARLAAWFARRREAPAGPLFAVAVRAALGCAAAWFANQLFGLIFFRPRPFVSLRGVHELVVKPATDKSFPSDHSTLAFVIAFSVAFERPYLGAVVLLLAALVAWGRVFVGVHYPTDVFVGAVVGCLWALAARAADRRFGLAVLTGRWLARAAEKSGLKL